MWAGVGVRACLSWLAWLGRGAVLGRLLAGVGVVVSWAGVVLVHHCAVVGLWWWARFPSIKFEIWGAIKKDWPRGYRSGLHFWTSPPYVCILCRGWRGWVVGWAGVIHANVVRL